MNNKDCRQLHKTAVITTALRRAFTLIELLIVIALTALLLTLLIVPLISALRYTQQAQIVTAAQDAARITRGAHHAGAGQRGLRVRRHQPPVPDGEQNSARRRCLHELFRLAPLKQHRRYGLSPMRTAPSLILSCRSLTTMAEKRQLTQPPVTRLRTRSRRTARRLSATPRLCSRWPPAQMRFATSWASKIRQSRTITRAKAKRTAATTTLTCAVPRGVPAV